MVAKVSSNIKGTHLYKTLLKNPILKKNPKLKKDKLVEIPPKPEPLRVNVTLKSKKYHFSKMPKDCNLVLDFSKLDFFNLKAYQEKNPDYHRTVHHSLLAQISKSGDLGENESRRIAGRVEAILEAKKGTRAPKGGPETDITQALLQKIARMRERAIQMVQAD